MYDYVYVLINDNNHTKLLQCMIIVISLHRQTENKFNHIKV